MQVRPARPPELRAIAEVLRGVAEERRWLLTRPPVDAAKLAARLEISQQAGDLVLALLDGEEIVGGLALQGAAAGGPAAGLGMAIAAEARGRGGGKALLDRALAYADEHGLERVELEVFDDNERAIGLYRSRGFTSEAPARPREGTHRRALRMVRRRP